MCLIFRSSENSIFNWGDDYKNSGYLTTDTLTIFQAAYNYFIENNGLWISSYYDENKKYISSKSNTSIISSLNNNIEIKNEEIFKKVINFIKSISLNNNFNLKLIEFVNNYYAKYSDSYLAFFAIKKYFDNIKQESFKYKVGDNLHVIGNIVDIKYYDNNYGTLSYITKIQTLTGENLIREGKVPVKENKEVNIYATIKYIKNCIIYLDRCITQPKKGISYINI